MYIYRTFSKISKGKYISFTMKMVSSHFLIITNMYYLYSIALLFWTLMSNESRPYNLILLTVIIHKNISHYITSVGMTLSCHGDHHNYQ